MGKNNGPYREEFPKGTKVKVINRAKLERFRESWNLHHKLEAQQLDYADRAAVVESVAFYHGADELYTLKGIPGIWHEQCLEAE
jgi:hypothetical protein